MKTYEEYNPNPKGRRVDDCTVRAISKALGVTWDKAYDLLSDKVGAMDTGIWRRLIVIPFNATIMGNSEIKNYSKYLLDNAGPYIVKWIIEGAQKAIKANFKLKLPNCVKEAVEKYKADNDWMSHFLDECCEIGEGFEEKSGELYAAYRAYCARSGEFTRSTTEFYTSIEQRGFTRHKRKNGRFVIGLQLADTEE